ncbi:uncharacterized protein LOC120767651 [Bactrocera tryoni]|uniref:uncharacterized protein LOC120767651 n=1 Tax=Bactrocera tryoni TaxID=59916 RepID=UPI001A970AA0|nr:uncharacterized protein LOC120767651 [Bactrocera tryoni]
MALLELSIIKDWYAKFGRGEINTENVEHSGRPKEVVTEENIKTVHKIVKSFEIAGTLEISSEHVHNIIHEYLVFYRSGPGDYFLSSDLKKKLAEKKFSSNKEIVTETEAYFETKDTSMANGIDEFKDRYNHSITDEGNYVE